MSGPVARILLGGLLVGASTFTAGVITGSTTAEIITGVVALVCWVAGFIAGHMV